MKIIVILLAIIVSIFIVGFFINVDIKTYNAMKKAEIDKINQEKLGQSDLRDIYTKQHIERLRNLGKETKEK